MEGVVTAIMGGTNWEGVIAAIVAVAASVAGVLIVMRGSRMLLAMIRGRAELPSERHERLRFEGREPELGKRWDDPPF